MSAAQAVLWLVVGPAVAVCAGVAIAWGLLEVGAWRRRRRQAERYALDLKMSERFKAELRGSVAPRKDEAT